MMAGNSDLLVEYRDKNLVRRGSIPSPDLDFKMQPVFNGVGTWSLSLPVGHPAVAFLKQPGSGIIVTNLKTGKTEMSGLTSKPSRDTQSGQVEGMATIGGYTDEALLAQALAFPDPANASVTAQTKTNDVRTGTAESLIRQYAAYNIMYSSGTWAPPGRLGGFRNFLTLEQTNKNLGKVLTKRPRFQNLLELLQEIAVEGGGLGFRVVQVDRSGVPYLELQIYQPTDRSAMIRLDIKNGTLQEEGVEISPPEVTRVVVAGQGEGTARQMQLVTTAESTTAESDWGLIIEEFKDQRNTNVPQELTDAGLGILAERGFTRVAVKAVPSNDQTMIYMEDFFLGDKVTVVIDGQETTAYITEAAVIANSSGVATGVAIGDIYDFDRESALRSSVEDNTRRIEQIERNVESVSLETINTLIAPLQPGGRLAAQARDGITDWNTVTESGWYRNNTSAANRPPGASTSWLIEVIQFSVTAVVQTAIGVGTNIGWVYRRTMGSGTWQAWKLLTTPQIVTSPTFTSGFTLGNGSATMRYTVSDGTCQVFVKITLGSTSSITGDILIAPPVPVAPLGSVPLHMAAGRLIVGSNQLLVHALVAQAALYIRKLNLQTSTIVVGYGNFINIAAFESQGATGVGSGASFEVNWIYPVE